MKLSQFTLHIPDSLIAQNPTENRDESRLLVLNKKTGEITHKIFKDIIDYFDDKDVFVFNNTKVFPARMYGKKERTENIIEVFLLRELNKSLRLWDVLVDPARKIRVGNKLYFGENDLLVAEVVDNTTSRGRTIRFLFEGTDEEFRQNIALLGETPLPKYIKRKEESSDSERFQTVYAKIEGAIAPPSAGMHFSKMLLKKLELKGIDFAEITLHVGLGSFRAIEVEDLTKHKMDSEHFIIEQSQANIVNKGVINKRRICAVGTTTVRATESSVSSEGLLKAANEWTSRFLFPPYEFAIANSMVTNFHPSESILLMQAAAFGGYEKVMNAYDVAIKEKYRFATYGDAMLII